MLGKENTDPHSMGRVATSEVSAGKKRQWFLQYEKEVIDETTECSRKVRRQEDKITENGYKVGVPSLNWPRMDQ